MRYLYLVVFLFFLTSCDPGVLYYYNVNNESDSTLYVCLMEKQEHTSDSCVTIPPLTHTEVYKIGMIGGAHDEGSEFLKYFDSFRIYRNIDSQYQITKPYLERSNWLYQDGKKEFMSSEGLYTITLKNEDI